MKKKFPVKISSRTAENLRKLEAYGFEFKDQINVTAIKRPVFQGRRGIAYKQVPSYVFNGTDPEGNPVEYHRRETRSPAAGQTYLKTTHGNIQVHELLDLFGGTSRESLRARPGKSSKGAIAHYSNMVPKKKDYWTYDKVPTTIPAFTSMARGRWPKGLSKDEKIGKLADFYKEFGCFPPNSGSRIRIR